MSLKSYFFLLDGTVVEPDMSAGFCPDHKAAMVLFLDRVYGIEDQDFLLHLLEVGFLPDLRAAASLDTVRVSICFYIGFLTLLNTTAFFISWKSIFYVFPSSAFLKCWLTCMLLLSFDNIWRCIMQCNAHFLRINTLIYKSCSAFTQENF